MSTQQIQQTAAPARQVYGFLAIGLVIMMALVLLATLAQPRPAAVPTARPAAQEESWSPGGHITGSVYDGGDYSTARVEPWSPGGHITGSVYDGGDYGTKQEEPWSPGGHITGSVYDGN